MRNGRGGDRRGVSEGFFQVSTQFIQSVFPGIAFVLNKLLQNAQGQEFSVVPLIFNRSG